MGRGDGSPENKLRGYKAAMHNPRVSDQAKAHAEEVRRYSSDQSGQSDEDRHTGNMKRGLKAAMHNPRNTGEGRTSAKNKLKSMGEDVGPTE